MDSLVFVWLLTVLFKMFGQLWKTCRMSDVGQFNEVPCFLVEAPQLVRLVVKM